MKGICGRLLEVDLTSGVTKDHGLSEDVFSKYLGGRGLGARLPFDMLPAKTDPLSPGNLLFFLTGPSYGNQGSRLFQVCGCHEVSFDRCAGATATRAGNCPANSRSWDMTAWSFAENQALPVI